MMLRWWLMAGVLAVASMVLNPMHLVLLLALLAGAVAVVAVVELLAERRRLECKPPVDDSVIVRLSQADLERLGLQKGTKADG